MQVLELLGPAEPQAAEDDAEDEDETQMLEHMLESSSGPVDTPADPVLHRLLPDGYRNDDGAAGEFRRLTESSLRSAKRGALQRVVADLSSPGAQQPDGGVTLDINADAAQSWLPALTDVRLAFGTRLGITEDMELERAAAEAGSLQYAQLAVYDWLSWLQDKMVRAISRD
jgi:hypothetical protein